MSAIPFASALDDDREQPLRVGADSAEHNEMTGVTIYTGNVVITQGSMRIEADKVTLKTLKGQANRVDNMIAVGNPARLQQKPKPEDSMMYARAQRIVYFVADDRVQLVDKASIEQDDSVVNSDQIEYLVKQRIVKAHGGVKAGTGEKPKRVEFIYTPQKANGANGTPDSTPATPDASTTSKPPAASSTTPQEETP